MLRCPHFFSEHCELRRLRDRNQIGTSNRRGAFAERALIRRSRRRLLLVFGGGCVNRIRKAQQN
jgi:hypothetical protein